MITDSLLQLSNAQTVSGSGEVSDNTVDLLQAKDIGAGEEIYVHFSTVTAPAGATSVEFQIITSAAANLGTPTVIGSSGAIPIAQLSPSLASGRVVVKANPKVGGVGQRYLGARYVVVGTLSGTDPAFTAEIVKDYQDGLKFYPSAFTVA